MMAKYISCWVKQFNVKQVKHTMAAQTIKYSSVKGIIHMYFSTQQCHQTMIQGQHQPCQWQEAVHFEKVLCNRMSGPELLIKMCT